MRARGTRVPLTQNQSTPEALRSAKSRPHWWLSRSIRDEPIMCSTIVTSRGVRLLDDVRKPPSGTCPSDHRAPRGRRIRAMHEPPPPRAIANR